jgi:succinate-acetate transporter protein
MVGNLKRSDGTSNFYVIDAESLKKLRTKVVLVDTTANPVPFGLIGFAFGIFTTGLNALDCYAVTPMVLSFMLFMGGLA